MWTGLFRGFILYAVCHLHIEWPDQVVMIFKSCFRSSLLPMKSNVWRRFTFFYVQDRIYNSLINETPFPKPWLLILQVFPTHYIPDGIFATYSFYFHMNTVYDQLVVVHYTIVLHVQTETLQFGGNSHIVVLVVRSHNINVKVIISGSFVHASTEVR